MDPAAPEPSPPLVPRRGGRLGDVLALVSLLGLLALWSLTLTGRAWRAPPAAFSAAVTFLPYLYAATAAWLFALWCVAPDRRSIPALLIALVASGAALWGPTWPSWSERTAGEPVRMMSWNLRRLWGGPGEVGTPEQKARATACVVEGIEAADPDVLTLLEVSGSDVDALASRLDLSCVHSDYTGRGGEQFGGLATCTRGDRWRLRRGAPQRFVDAEDWYYVFSEIERNERVFNLLAVHLHPYRFSTERLRDGVRDLSRGEPASLLELQRDGASVFAAQGNQSAALLEHVSGFEDPTVVAGDFNSTRDTALHTALRRHLTDAWERGGRGFGGTVRFLDRIPLRVDYVYVTDTFAVGNARVPEIHCSDHRPVVTDLVLRGMDDPAGRAQD